MLATSRRVTRAAATAAKRPSIIQADQGSSRMAGSGAAGGGAATAAAARSMAVGFAKGAIRATVGRAWGRMASRATAGRTTAMARKPNQTRLRAWAERPPKRVTMSAQTATTGACQAALTR